MAANQSSMRAETIGDVKIKIHMGSGTEEVTAKDVVYVPESAVNLLSVSKLIEKNLSVHFTPRESYIEDSGGNKMATMSNDGGIFKLIRQKRGYTSQRQQEPLNFGTDD